MTASLLGLGTAIPAHSVAQHQAAAIAADLCAASVAGARTMAALYRRSAVRSRGSVLFTNGLPDDGVQQSFFVPAASRGDRGPSTAARLSRYSQAAPGLASAAASAALAEAGLDPARVTHLITVSCTGFEAPGVDAALVAQLPLSPAVQRTHIGFMGCHGAINALRVAAAFARADPAARVLLCAVELCSLHFHYTSDPDKMVANALFADGAAAAVIAGSAACEPGTGRDPAPPIGRIAATASCIFPDSADVMTWRIGDHGFEMTLSPRVPDLLSRLLPGWLSEVLASHGLSSGDIASWVVHPGGPRVLSVVQECLGLADAALAPSRAILAEHGNMSSPTVLFIADRLRRDQAAADAPSHTIPCPCVCLAFGPGLTAEAALIL